MRSAWASPSHNVARLPHTRARHYLPAARLFFSRQQRPLGRLALRQALRLTPFNPILWRDLLLLEVSSLLPPTWQQRPFRYHRHPTHTA
jgi:hypothetical protein